MNDVMIDIETLGTKPGSVILSIGAALFNRSTGEIGHEYYVEIDAVASERAGFTINGDTMMWWLRQPEQARAVFNGSVSPGNALADFTAWCAHVGIDRRCVWTQGDMDLPMIAALAARFGQPVPWKFWSYRDTRTAYDVAGFDARTIRREGTYHNALDDVRHQVKCLVTALNMIGGAK